MTPRSAPGSPSSARRPSRKRLTVAGTLRQTLRYGENPHQAAAFYASGARPGVATAIQVQGKELSYNNLNDTDAAFECVAEFDAPTIAIIKHANPCGVASAPRRWPMPGMRRFAAIRCRPTAASSRSTARWTRRRPRRSRRSSPR